MDGYLSLLDEISAMPVIDTHEHLIPERVRLASGDDFFATVLRFYVASDLISCGMPRDRLSFLKSKDAGLDDKIKVFMPYWERAKNTALCRILKISMGEIYGAGDIDETTIPQIDAQMKRQCEAGFYKKILRDLCGIEYYIWDPDGMDFSEPCELARLSIRFDEFMLIGSRDDIEALEGKYGEEFDALESLEAQIERLMTRYKAQGMVSIKCGLAYDRTLRFERVGKSEARSVFDKLRAGARADAKKLQDYLMFSTVEKACDSSLPVQIHTGYLEGNGNDINNANPAHLYELLRSFPDAKFDLFHGGYPFGGEISALGKMFANVYLDMTWMFALSPEFSMRMLGEWLDTVPAAKILGFGGDYNFVEGVFGHLQLARQCLARVFAQKVERGVYSMSECREFARMLLYENARELYGG